jgi:hypothetical protein
VRRLSTEERLKRLIDGSPESIKKYMQKVTPYLAIIINLVDALTPIISFAIEKGTIIYHMLPHDYLLAIYGLSLLFFGGHFAATIAVVEAFRVSGGHVKVYECLRDLWAAGNKLGEANKKDDEVDDNGDGIADVDQISPVMLFARKVGLALRTVDPQVVNGAVQGLYQMFMAAVLVVKYRFAKTIALGNSIGGFLVRGASYVLEPILKRLVSEPYQKWSMLVVTYICKGTGISIAWWLQLFQSIFQSSILGALTFSRAFVMIIHKRGMLPNIKSHEDTYLDEIIGWVLAPIGMYFQFKTSLWGVPFPANVILLPISIFEWTLRWAASSNMFTQAAVATQ